MNHVSRARFLPTALAAAASLCLGAALSAHAAENPWIGTWSLDKSKSHFAGETFALSKKPDGMMHLSNGPIDYDFAIDGKPYKSAYDRTTTWTAKGERSWHSETMLNGKNIASWDRTLSADGKTLNMTVSGTKPDGSAFKDEQVWERVSGKDGLEGKWKLATLEMSAPDGYVISEPSPGVMRWEIPAYQNVVEGKFDGTDLPIKGPQSPAGMTIGVKQSAPMTLSAVFKVKGKLDSYSTDTLAADHKSFTEVSWSPGKKSEASTAVYVKQ